MAGNVTSMVAPARLARDKIRTAPELGSLAAAARAAGQTVVLAHGVFDLIHMGHVRHLEEARRHGELLIVSVTADAYVNKGPGRPVFTDTMRAEMLAALEYVDWVGINHAGSAEPMIEAVKPDVYAKGPDYAEAADDITGKITDERTAVETNGGRVVFTDDVTFSSSALLNRHFDIYDPAVKGYLETLRENGHFNDIMGLLDKVADMKVLVVGDTIIDEYQYVTPMGKSSKENLIGNLYKERELFAGGVIAAANHVAGICKQVDVLTCLGTVDSHESLVHASLKPNVTMKALVREGAPTTRKCRFVDPGYMRKLFEVYHMDDSPLPGDLARTFDQHVAARAGDYDLVIVTDFGHGLIGPSAIQTLSEHAKFLAVNAQTNSANTGYNLVTRYPKADFVCIDAPEARLAVGDKLSDVPTIASRLLPERVACGNVIVTHGKFGCVAWTRGRDVMQVPAFTSTVVDTVGAGDAFLAVTSPLVAAGGDISHVAFVGNVAGAIKVGIVGHRKSVEKAPLIKAITALLK